VLDAASRQVVHGIPKALSAPAAHDYLRGVRADSVQHLRLADQPLAVRLHHRAHFWDLDMSLAKDFQFLEKFRAQLKLTAYNATNKLNLGDPDTNIYDSTFGLRSRKNSAFLPIGEGVFCLTNFRVFSDSGYVQNLLQLAKGGNT
jgi:hypothetical protein